MKEKAQVQIFLAYSRKDTDMLGEFVPHLSILERTHIVDRIWFDGKIEPGTNWDNEINENLQNSDIIILLISADFIASEYCYGKELKKAVGYHKSGKTKVIPIILRSCIWKDTLFSKIQVLPKNGKPVNSWNRKDEVFAEITLRIKEIAISIKNKKSKAINALNKKRQEEYALLIKKAEEYFSDQKWKPSLIKFKSAKSKYKEGFVPNFETINEKINKCSFELTYEKKLSAANSMHKLGDYLQALKLFKGCQSLKKSDEVEKLIEECRKFSLLQKLINDQRSEIVKLAKIIYNLSKRVDYLEAIRPSLSPNSEFVEERRKEIESMVDDICKNLILMSLRKNKTNDGN